MSRIVHDFVDPDRFVLGTVGQPGERAFFVQASDGQRTVSLSLEKQHAKVLGESIDKMLNELAQNNPQLELPPSAQQLEDAEPLTMPVDPEFPLGAIALNWSQEGSFVVIDLVSAENGMIADEEILDDENHEHDVVRIQLTPYSARQFSLRCQKVVDAGRAECPLCGELMSAQAHLCVRLNGYHKRSPAELAALLEN